MSDQPPPDPWKEPASPPPAPGTAAPAPVEAGALAVLADSARELLRERRRERRWRLFFRAAWLIVVLLVLAQWRAGSDMTAATLGGGRHAAKVSVDGLIAPGTDASAERVLHGLRTAFADREAAGIILDINSPGGSPVQAGQVYAELRRLRAQHPDKPVYAVIGDVGASGAYYIAAGAQEIYADRASLVGSIGVRMDGFGFVEAMQRLGIERRLLTSGANKGLLDPFSPVQPAQLAHVQTLLDAIHQQFIAAVREGRGERLHETPEIFSGLFWTGEQAQALGLVDGYGSVESIARDKLGTTQIRDHTQQEKPFERLFGQVESTLAGALTRAFGLDSPLR